MIVLASASPRRKELLSLITRHFEVDVSGADEDCEIREPRELVMRLARKKAEAVFARRPEDIVIGADTVVQSPSGEIFGKPADLADAARMLRALSGKMHRVHTGVCVLRAGRADLRACGTKVFFRPISEEELRAYLKTEQVTDKAGAYAAQGAAAKFVERIDGDFWNIVGLPVSVVYGMLKEAGAEL